jgi:hypothetical protein
MTEKDHDYEIIRMPAEANQLFQPLYIRTKNCHGVLENNEETMIDAKPRDYFVRQFKPKIWTKKKTFVCLHDSNPYTGFMISIPISYTPGEGYGLYGQFCSFSCALAHIIENKDLHVSSLSILLHRMAISVYGYMDNIQPAVPRSVLNMFRGEDSEDEDEDEDEDEGDEDNNEKSYRGLDIETFRQQVQKPVQLLLIHPPFYPVSEHVFSKPSRGHPDYHQIACSESMRTRGTNTSSSSKFIPPEKRPPSGEIVPLDKSQEPGRTLSDFYGPIANSGAVKVNGEMSDDSATVYDLTTTSEIHTKNSKRISKKKQKDLDEKKRSCAKNKTHGKKKAEITTKKTASVERPSKKRRL